MPHEIYNAGTKTRLSVPQCVALSSSVAACSSLTHTRTIANNMRDYTAHTLLANNVTSPASRPRLGLLRSLWPGELETGERDGLAGAAEAAQAAGTS